MASLVVLALLVGACDGGGADNDFGLRQRVHARPTSSDTRVIGFVGTMSGPGAWRGEDAFEGADVAVHVINRRLEDDEQRFELVTLDDEGDAERATELVEQLAASPRTAGIVYAGPPEGLPPAEGALAEAGIPAVLCYGDLYGAKQLSAHVYQASPSYLWEARRLARYALGDRRYQTIGALTESSLDGRTAAAALRAELARAGGRLKVALEYPSTDEGFATALERLRSSRIEALVIQGSPQALGRIVADLDDMGATYRGTQSARIASERNRKGNKQRGERSTAWRPQLLSFDGAINAQTDIELPPGIVAADTYARGAHYLPVPSFVAFRRVFVDWWGSEPLGWEVRGFDAASMIAWAAERADADDDRAEVLEGLAGARFGGLDVTLGPDDHTAVSATAVGLWVVPSPAATVRERAKLPEGLPWVPLARGFSIDDDTTDIAARDWRYLFRKAPPPTGPAPPLERMRFGVRTPRSDPVH